MSVELRIPDLSSYETFVNGFPHDAFVQLREHAPVWWHEPTERTPDGEGFWCVSTHELVVEVFRSPRIYSSHTGGERPYGGTMINDMEMSGKLLNMMDDPRHQRIRRLVSNGFTPRRIARLRDELETISHRTLESVAPRPGERGACDLVVDVAAELPLQAICLLLGAPGEDRHSLCEWVDVTSSDFSDEVPAAVRSGASVNLFQYGQRLIAARTAEPRDDLLSVVIHAEMPDQDPPRLDKTEVAMFWSLLFTAGAETTRKAIATGVWELSKSPEQFEALRADRSMMPAAIEEIVRWTTPSVYKRRTATTDTVLGSQADPSRRQGRGLGDVGQPGRGRLRRALPVPHRSHSQQPCRVRAWPPLLSGRQPGPAGDRRDAQHDPRPMAGHRGHWESRPGPAPTGSRA